MDDDKRIISAVDFYFLQEDGNRFKVTLAGNSVYVILYDVHIVKLAGW